MSLSPTTRNRFLGIVGATVVASFLPSAPLHAQELRAYQLELIVFRPLQTAHLDERQWQEAERAQLEATQALEALGVDVVAAQDAPAPFADGFGFLTQAPSPTLWQPPLPERFANVTETSRELTPLFDRLRRSSAYQPLLHERWLQLSFPRDEANAREIGADGDDYSLTGTVKLAVERRLHLELDLTLSQSERVDYTLAQSRVMTSGELHYLDHPALGAVVKITPAELPEGYPAAFLADILADARLYAADPSRRLLAMPWPAPLAPPLPAEQPLEPPSGATDDAANGS